MSLRNGYIRSGHMKIHGTKEGVDIVNEKTEGRQHTVFKENWSTGKTEPVQSKNSQAISFGGSADCPGQTTHYQKKYGIMDPFRAFFLPEL